MKVVLTPNPYRDRNFAHVEQAVEILENVTKAHPITIDESKVMIGFADYTK